MSQYLNEIPVLMSPLLFVSVCLHVSVFIHSLIPDTSIAHLQVHYSSPFSLCLSTCICIHSFIDSGYFYSASSSPLLLRGVIDYSIDTVSELTYRRATGSCE